MRRRGRDIGLGGVFVEREEELATLRETMAAARRGAGTTLVIEGPTGSGKSRLLTVAGDLAREQGMQVLGASASELQQDYPFGVAIQLFEPRWTLTSAEDRAALSESPARAVVALLEGDFPEPLSHGNHAYPLIHGLFSLMNDLLAAGPLVMIVDDIHWSDRLSLGFLIYLTRRLADMPIVLVVTVRNGGPVADRQALNALMWASTSVVLHPGPISTGGVESLVRSEFPDADDSFVRACARVTRGNPLALRELLTKLRVDGRAPDSASAERLIDLAPEAIVSSVVARLGTMPAAARALACAVSVLGDGADLRHVAELAGLTSDGAERAAEGLASVHMLRPGLPLSFVHPLIRSAVAASMSPLARGHAHRRAAAILRADKLPVEAIAAHLLFSPAGFDPEAVEILRYAAERGLASGSAASAVRLLERALAEQPGPKIRAEIVAELAKAEALEAMPQAMDRQTGAINQTESPRRRAALALALSQALYARASYRQAAEVLDEALAELQIEDESLTAELEAAYVSAASLVPSLAGTLATRRERILGRVVDAPTPAQRSAVAHIAAMASLLGDSRSSIRELAELAWGGGGLLGDDAPDGASWALLTAALLFSDELERVIEICDAALVSAGSRLSPLELVTINHCLVWPRYEQGRVLEAATAAEAAIDARPNYAIAGVRTAYGALACCYIQRGQLEQAETALAAIDEQVRETVRYPFLLEVCAQLRLALHRPEEALADALQVGERLRSDFAADNPGVIAWRSTAALAHLALGQPEQAVDLAQAELEHAQRIGVTRTVIRDLRVLGLAKGGAEGVELLTEAVRIGQQYPTRLEYMHALVDLGGALRRSNQRAAAREPLRQALELSHRGGVAALAMRAQTELTATGARLRRIDLTGIDSLTPSERRVAELAAQGLTTRRIAESLFVTPKTVEFHLRHIYRKLDINSRAQLADAFDRHQTA